MCKLQFQRLNSDKNKYPSGKVTALFKGQETPISPVVRARFTVALEITGQSQDVTSICPCGIGAKGQEQKSMAI